MPFKVKINVLLLLAILVTIGTAWFSVNHFISGYIRTQATQNINEQITPFTSNAMSPISLTML